MSGSVVLVVAATAGELRGIEGVEGAEALTCGVGPVDAAARVAGRLAIGPSPAAVLHVGIAGCRRGAGIELGELVVGVASTYCDTASSLVARRLEPDARLLERARTRLPQARLLAIGTSADVGGTGGADADVEAMEGFAVLRAAALAGVPAIEVRAVSNEVEEPDRGLWRFELALDALAEALPGLVGALRE